MRSSQYRYGQRGLALIMVLGLVVFLSIVALSFSETQRVSSHISANMLGIARAQAAADGAVHRMLYEVSRPRSTDAEMALLQWKADGVAHEWQENGVTVVVSAKSEAAKIDLNFASEPLLKAVFTATGVDETAADAIVAAIKDWTDADDLKRPNGAEADDYRAAGMKVLPSNEQFTAIEELQNVFGVTPQIYNAVARYLTVNSRTSGIDPMSASLDVLNLLPGIDAAQAADWVAQRDQALRDGVAVPAIPFSSPYFASAQNVIRIRADGFTPEGLKASREASVRVGSGVRGNPQFFLWQKGLPADANSPLTTNTPNG